MTSNRLGTLTCFSSLASIFQQTVFQHPFRITASSCARFWRLKGPLASAPTPSASSSLSSSHSYLVLTIEKKACNLQCYGKPLSAIRGRQSAFEHYWENQLTWRRESFAMTVCNSIQNTSTYRCDQAYSCMNSSKNIENNMGSLGVLQYKRRYECLLSLLHSLSSTPQSSPQSIIYTFN